MANGVDKSAVRVESRAFCQVCGKKGQPLYKDIKDRLFFVPGSWSLSKCPDEDCGLIWLDPMPVKDDLFKLYSDYCTHKDSSIIETKKKTFSEYLFLFIKFVTFWPKRSNRYACMYLNKEKPGKILDIGCGNGIRLKVMSSLGWDAVGVEVDSVARSIAQKNTGCKVYSEELKQIGFPDNYFDAVVMCHVFEHVHDPIGLLKESLRVLKPGGKFVATTPNSLSLGHRVFKSFWFPLDPPRHLYIFSERSIRKIALLLGVNVSVSTETFNAPLVVAWSFTYRKGLSKVISMLSFCVIRFMLWEWLVRLFDKEAGEENVFIIQKT